MRTIVHLSDLHFGRVRYEVLSPLLELVAGLNPDLVAVSGDLTMQARNREFSEARAFLDRLPQPVMVVPGNHDLPHFRPVECLLNPLERFERHITRDLEPYYEDAEIAVAGVNTARGFRYRAGRINVQQVNRTLERFRCASQRATRIVVTHHPFDLPAQFRSRELVGRARLALETFLEAGADVFLAGHMHLTYCGHTAERWKIRDYAALVIQAGTATSTRERDECNAFNVLRVHGEQIEVQAYNWTGATFDPTPAETFHRTPKGWRSYAAVQPPSMVITDPVTNSASPELR